MQRLADHGGFALHECFREVFAPFFVRKDIGQHFTHGQDLFADAGQVDAADDGNGQAELGELEQADGGLAVGHGDAVDDEIGARADEGAGPAEHGRIG